MTRSADLKRLGDQIDHELEELIGERRLQFSLILARLELVVEYLHAHPAGSNPSPHISANTLVQGYRFAF